MPPILDKAVRSSRVHARRWSLPALALGLCAITCLAQQAALGQAQLGSAETSFDEGPDKLPAVPSTPIPTLRAELPAQIALAVLPQRHRNSNPATARPVHALVAHTPVQDSHARIVPLSKKRQPEGTLTAAR